jgi:hypothetical protein
MVIYHGILTLEKVGTAVNYHGISITLPKNTWYFNVRKRRYHGKLLQYFYNIIGPGVFFVAERLNKLERLSFPVWGQCYKNSSIIYECLL